MSLPALLAGMPEILGAAAADASGEVLEATAGSAQCVDRDAAAAIAAALGHLAAAGRSAGLARLDTLSVKGADRATLAAVRPEGFLLVAVDPTRPTARIEAALRRWTPPARPEPARAAPPRPPALPRPANGAAAPSPAQLPRDGGVDATFAGQLSDFALPDLLEFLRAGRRTGLLVCTSASGVGTLRFRGGSLTGATSPHTPAVGQVPQRIAIAVREMVHWQEGQFAFTRERDRDAPPGEVEVDAQMVLLNVFKEMDERARGPLAAAEPKP